MTRSGEGEGRTHWVIRDATVADHPVVLAMNNAEVPALNELTSTDLAWLAEHAVYFRVAVDAAGVAGFVICLPSGIDYWSGNYAWFTARHDRFLYLDRVAVAPRAQGRGAGRALYEDMHAFAKGRWPRVTLEVNLRPPNPVSDAFHARMGYVAVGVREYNEGANAVTMLERQM